MVWLARARARSKALAIAAAAFVLALFAATPGQATSFITLPVYAKRADAVCADYHRKAAHLPQVAASDFPGLVKLTRSARAIVTADNRRLRAIPLPRAKRTLVQRWLRRGYDVPALLRALELAAEKKSVALVLAANRALDANGAARRVLARRLGMKACSHS
jgi:hypothetical protein